MQGECFVEEQRGKGEERSGNGNRVYTLQEW